VESFFSSFPKRTSPEIIERIKRSVGSQEGLPLLIVYLAEVLMIEVCINLF
jgi:hypothetical protein